MSIPSPELGGLEAGPSKEVAEREALKLKLRRNVTDAENPSAEQLIPLCEHPEEFGCGTGVSTYFYLLKMMTWMFFFMAIFSAAMMALYYQVNPFNIFNLGLKWEEVIVRLSMGNYVIGLRERYNVTKDIAAGLPSSFYEQLPSPIKFPWYCALLDLGALLVFVASAFGFNRKIDAMAEKADRNLISVEDYSVAVEGLPKQLKDAAPVAKYFSKFGAVHSVVLCYKIPKWVPLQAELNLAYKKYKLQQIEIDRKKKRPQSRDDADEARGIHKVDPFFSPEDEGKCMEKFTRTLGLDRDLVFWKKKIAGLVSQRSKLLAKEGDPKDDKNPAAQMAFVTFQYSAGAAKCLSEFTMATHRRFGAVRTQSGIEPFTFQGASYMLWVHQPPEPTDIKWENVHFRGAVAVVRKYLADVVTYALCGVSFVAYFFMMRAKDSAARGEYALLNRLPTIVVSIGYSCIVIIIGTVLKMFLTKLATFENAHTKSDSIVDLVEKLWISDFINSGVILLVFTAIFPPDEDTWAMGEPHPHGFLRYYWYLNTATSLATTIIIDCVKVTFMEGFKPVDLVLGFISKRRAKTQAALNEAYEPLEWDFAVLVGYLIKDIFVGMFLCMLVPITVPVIFLFLFGHYWIVKYNLLRRCKAPLQYDKAVSAHVSKILPAAFHIHCFLAALVYFGTVAFNKDLIDENWAKSPVAATGSGEWLGFTGSWAGWAIVIFYVVVCVFIFFRWLKRRHDTKKKKHAKSESIGPDETGGRPFTEVQDRILNYIDCHPLFVGPDLEHGGAQDQYDLSPLRSVSYFSYWSAQPLRYQRGVVKSRGIDISRNKAGSRIGSVTPTGMMMMNPIMAASASAGTIGATVGSPQAQSPPPMMGATVATPQPAPVAQPAPMMMGATVGTPQPQSPMMGMPPGAMMGAGVMMDASSGLAPPMMGATVDPAMMMPMQMSMGATVGVPMVQMGADAGGMPMMQMGATVGMPQMQMQMQGMQAGPTMMMGIQQLN